MTLTTRTTTVLLFTHLMSTTGEGKTSIILPMLAAVLADGTALVRVTVPAPLFTTNLALLTSKLGGLLNRCVNVLPCRRDMSITVATAGTMLHTLQQCTQSKGIVMALPEHRLSFQLKFVEHCSAGNTAAAARHNG
jgi:Protein of unknown function (DUF3638)